MNRRVIAVESTDSTQSIDIDIGVNPVADFLCKLLPTAILSECFIFDELFGTFHFNYKKI